MENNQSQELRKLILQRSEIDAKIQAISKI